MRSIAVVAIAVVLAGSGTSCGQDGEQTLTVYSGRSQELIRPLVERFEQQTGITVDVRYGDTAELAAAILEEGDNSPADVFWAQDAGALGALAAEGRFTELRPQALDRVAPAFRSPDDRWVGTSGRARALVYNTSNLGPVDLPDSVLDLTDEAWRGRIGWAPTNGSFQSFVTALRLLEGDEVARVWLEEMRDNNAQVYEGNSPIVRAVAAGEVDTGLVNHYYLLQLGVEDPSVADNAANHFFGAGDAGSLVNVAGVAILETTRARTQADAFVDFLLSTEAGEFLAREVFEYPLVDGVGVAPGLPALDEISQPDIDLSDLADLEGTLELMREAGVL